MAKLGIKELQMTAVEIVRAHPEGIRYVDLVRQIADEYPDTPINTVHGAVSKLASDHATEVVKPARGLFKPLDSQRPQAPTEQPADSTVIAKTKVKEEDFYQPFAEWLQNVLDECTLALPLGGKVQNQKWGTPDVIGVYKPLTRDLIKFTPEIVTAEIKTDANQTVTAFGQAVAYRLFATKTYLVIPTTVDLEDLSRIEAMCMLLGVGLVLFDLDSENANFEIRMRAQRFSPDMFFVNEFVERLKDHDREVFDQLFG